MRGSHQFRPRRLNPAGNEKMNTNKKASDSPTAAPRLIFAGVQRGGGGIGGFFYPMKTYAEKLKDPRWQRKRLEILQRDDFTCRACGSRDNTLHVHHIRYFRGRNPWDYKEFYLVTLCEGCHEAEEAEIKAATCKRKANQESPRQSHFHSFAEKQVVDDKELSPEEIESFFANLTAELAKTKAPKGGQNGR